MPLRIVLLVVLCCSWFVTKAQVSESFSDGDFTNDPPWLGDSAEWNVIDGQLQSNGAAVTGNVIHLSTPSETAYGQWEFFVNPKVSTTSGNYMEVHLIADTADLETPHNGYFVRIGNTNDDVSLYRTDAGTAAVIIDGPNGMIASASNNPTKIKVTRNDSNIWELFVDSTGMGVDFVSIGTAADSLHSNCSFFGVLVKHSATNNQKYFFDDLYAGPVLIDSVAAVIVDVNAVHQTAVNVLFSEPLESESAQNTANYFIAGIGNPTSATLDNDTPSLVHLAMPTTLTNGTYTLVVSSLGDLSGNVLIADTAAFTFYQPVAGAIVINEVLPDFDPGVGLPAAEFIELFNTTVHEIDIADWSLGDATGNATIPAYTIPPSGFVILTPTSSQTQYAPFGPTLGVPGFPSLNNTGDDIVLKNQNGMLIDRVSYTDDWYQDADKQDGGWSLERINPYAACSGARNWSASTSNAGGTPGMQNSVFDATPDTTGPQIASVSVLSSALVEIVFNEALDSLAAVDASRYHVDNGIGNPTNVYSTSLDFTTVTLSFSQPLPAGIVYTITVTNLPDCALNITVFQTALLVVPDTAAPGDVVINEILFNPPSFGFDYVELYNRSEKIIDAGQLFLWNTDNTGLPDDFTVVATSPRLLLPGEYLLVTEDAAWVAQNFPTRNDSVFVEVPDLPGYADEGGTVLVTNANNGMIDKLTYSEDWQYAILEDDNGVALERLSADAPTQDSMNWHSAATAVGYGTPGLENSQRVAGEQSELEATLEPKVFSPDGDGYNDVLTIRYNFDKPGFTLNIKIFNEAGALVSDLVNGRLAELHGFATWDGTDSRNERAAVGPYVIWMEAFNPNGEVKRFKNVCVLAGRIE